jgi:hypothetical protein
VARQRHRCEDYRRRALLKAWYNEVVDADADRVRRLVDRIRNASSSRRAPDAARFRLLRVLLNDGASLASVRRHCVALLVSRDGDLATDMYTVLETFHGGAEVWDVMESAMALGPTAAVRG